MGLHGETFLMNLTVPQFSSNTTLIHIWNILSNFRQHEKSNLLLYFEKCINKQYWCRAYCTTDCMWHKGEYKYVFNMYSVFRCVWIIPGMSYCYFDVQRGALSVQERLGQPVTTQGQLQGNDFLFNHISKGSTTRLFLGMAHLHIQDL